MSYTKETLFTYIFEPTNSIKKQTADSVDCSKLIEYLNNFLVIRDSFLKNDSNSGILWNEICIDLIATINSAFSGFYRSAIIELRSILELGCNSFYYYDHKIEYHMFKYANQKADKYVSTLVNEFDFYKTRYIYAFCDSINESQVEEDSIAKYLQKLYAQLSDVVHGRYNKLTNIVDFHISYNIDQFKQYEKFYFQTVGILCVMAMLRFNLEKEKCKDIIQKTGVINYDKILG